MKNIKATSFLLFAILFSVCSCAQSRVQNAKPYFDVYEGLEFDMPRVQEPATPQNSVNIKDFGAVSGGQVLNSNAFADAIKAVSEMGGGKVVIPAGIWLTGPIILKSNLELYTEPGTVVIFSDNKDLYRVIETSFEGLTPGVAFRPFTEKIWKTLPLPVMVYGMVRATHGGLSKKANLQPISGKSWWLRVAW